jgi:hypothetical protein
MDLIEYLQSYKKGQKLMRKRGKKKPARPRRARGYGQRSSKYNSSNNESFNNNMETLLTTILAAVTVKPTPERLMEGTTYNPLGARIGEREIFNRMYNRPDLEDQFTIDEKKGIRKAIKAEEVEDPEKIEQQKAFIFNTTQDFDMKMKEILDKQNDLEDELSVLVDFGDDSDISEDRRDKESNMPLSFEASTNLRKQNLRIKEEVVAQSLKLQELLNDAEDLNDYKDLLKKHNELISKTTDGFVRMDNYIAEEQIRTIDELEDDLNSYREQISEGIQIGSDNTKKLSEEIGKNIALKKELTATRAKAKNIVAQQDFQRFGILGQEIRGNIQQRIIADQLDEIGDQYEDELIEEIDAEKKSGVLGVLGRDVIAGIRQRVDTAERSKTETRLRGRLLEEGKRADRAEELFDMGVLEKQRAIRKGLGQEILIRKKKSFIGELKGDIDELFTRREKEKEEQEKFFKREKEDLETLLEREEEAGEQQQEQIFELEQETEKQKGAITRGLGREIVGRKKQRTKELEFSSKLIETNTGQIESMKKTNELLEKLDKAQIQKENAQAQLRGLKQYADSLNDQILASGEKGVTAQQQFFDRKIEDMENNLRMEKQIALDLNLKLAKSEAKEQALRKQLIDLENEVDNQAARELERTLSGLSDI